MAIFKILNKIELKGSEEAWVKVKSVLVPKPSEMTLRIILIHDISNVKIFIARIKFKSTKTVMHEKSENMFFTASQSIVNAGCSCV